jgi:antitoxin FitA
LASTGFVIESRRSPPWPEFGDTEARWGWLNSHHTCIDFNAINAYTLNESPENTTMASITIRNLEDDIKQRLRVRAAEHGRSMEEEVRDILRRVMGAGVPARNLAAAIRARVAPSGGVDLDLPAREPMREPAQFGRGR